MANGQGTSTIDFSTGLNEAAIAVTGQAAILATSTAEAFIMADDTTSGHSANDHRYFSALVGLSCGTPTAATGFTIYARSTEKLNGTFKVRWVWSDI
jgi:hypothetical protein